MRLLVLTQKINKNDPVLGFFHYWINSFAEKCEFIEVICLEQGDFNLPSNVSVYSLGKESGVSKVKYIKNFYKHLKDLSGKYDKVFVHMNQEYILLAGIYWVFKGVPVYLWRNHPSGSFLTQVAVFLSNKVFCTSRASFTAKFKKAVIMPAGVDTALFRPNLSSIRKKYSVCMIGRVSPIKHIDLALEAIKTLTDKGVQTSLSVIGPVAPKDEDYYRGLLEYVEKNNLSNIVSFSGSVSPEKLPDIYSSYEICLNLTPAGSFDKTVIESASCGAIPLVVNTSFKGLLPDVCITGNSKEDIASAIEKIFDPALQVKIQRDLENFVSSQSLNELTKKLFSEIK